MLGLLFIGLIYGITLAFCAAVKFILRGIHVKKRDGSAPSPKIYYVKVNKGGKKKKPSPTVPISGTVIDKEDYK